jgi:hypothetical protein
MLDELFVVVDKFGKPVLENVGDENKRFYLRESVAKGVATQYNNITVIKNGEGVQIPGAPFRAQRLKVTVA